MDYLYKGCYYLDIAKGDDIQFSTLSNKYQSKESIISKGWWLAKKEIHDELTQKMKIKSEKIHAHISTGCTYDEIEKRDLDLLSDRDIRKISATIISP